LSNKPSFHEKLTESDDVKIGSERAFGLVFAVMFLVIALFPLFTRVGQQDVIRVWALIVAVSFGLSGLVLPRLLVPLNKLWFRFGLLLHRVVSPLVMGLIFFLTITPIGLLMRTIGKRPLDLGFDRSVKSYWVYRTPPSPAPDTMKRQF